MSLRRAAGWLGMGLLLTMACQRGALEELPAVETEKFLPSIRSEVEAAVKAVREAPRDGERNGKLGMLLQAHDRMEAAGVCYRRAQALQPEEVRWWYYAGVVNAALARHGEAVKAFREALRQKPDAVAARLGLADALLESGEGEAARKEYAALLLLRADYPYAHYGLGRARAAVGDVAGAAESYRKAVGAFPGYGAARYALGLAARQLGQVEEGKQHLAAYERDKSGAPPREDPLLDAVRALSGGVLPLLGRAKSLAQAGKLPEAIALHLEALQLDPKQEQAHINLISLYGRGGDFEAAERHYGLALGLNPNRDEAHYNYGVMLQARGRLAAALEAYRKVLGVNPKHAEANNNIAYLLGSQGQLAAALRHAEAALENRPNYPQAHFNAGFLQVRLKNYAEAVRHFEAAAGANDENAARYLQALAGAQARAGNREEALRQARRAREAAMARRQGGVMAEIDREFPGLAR